MKRKLGDYGWLLAIIALAPFGFLLGLLIALFLLGAFLYGLGASAAKRVLRRVQVRRLRRIDARFQQSIQDHFWGRTTHAEFQAEFERYARLRPERCHEVRPLAVSAAPSAVNPAPKEIVN